MHIHQYQAPNDLFWVSHSEDQTISNVRSLQYGASKMSYIWNEVYKKIKGRWILHTMRFPSLLTSVQRLNFQTPYSLITNKVCKYKWILFNIKWIYTELNQSSSAYLEKWNTHEYTKTHSGYKNRGCYFKISKISIKYSLLIPSYIVSWSNMKVLTDPFIYCCQIKYECHPKKGPQHHQATSIS